MPAPASTSSSLNARTSSRAAPSRCYAVSVFLLKLCTLAEPRTRFGKQLMQSAFYEQAECNQPEHGCEERVGGC